MDRTTGRLLAGALALAALAFLAGCAAPRQEAKPDQPESPFSVHLPVLETTDMDVRAQPPVIQPEMTPPPPHPADAHEEGKARSLDLFRIERDGGKPARPPGEVPQESPGKP